MIMSILMKTKINLLWAMVLILSLFSCKDYFDPDLGVVLDDKDIFKEFNDYRTAGLGLYAIQQDLAEQIYILGEVRGDLVEITKNADRDLTEINNFSISPDNKYASPENFYKLIVNCNNLINKIVLKKPSVLDPKVLVDNYDKLYGEVQCMRAWAYFNAARIYGEIPYIYPNIQSMDDIEEYINTGKTVIAPEQIIFDLKGYYNDTLRNVSVVYNKIYLDLDAIVDSFSMILENNVKAVGIQYSIDNNDITWEVTTWSRASYHALLAQMYLFRGDYTKSMDHLNYFLYNNESNNSFIKYGLDTKFSNNNWKSIFTGLDNYEHIFTVWYSKNYRQQNNLQYFYSDQGGNQYMLKPTPRAVQYWEGTWDGFKILENTDDPSKTFTSVIGIPGDFYRGYGVSFNYIKNGVPMLLEDVELMLELKMEKRDREAQLMMAGVDTVVYKFSINKSDDDRDAYIPIYRAAGMHLYAAEIYAMWEFWHNTSNTVYAEISTGLTIVNNGYYAYNSKQKGVRGRVGFSNEDEELSVGNINYLFNPSTNEINGYIDLTNKSLEKQIYAVELILDERARELGFEGERFYDLMRVAKRTGNPAFLANKIAAKFNGSKAEEIRSLLMDENNWYVKFPGK